MGFFGTLSGKFVNERRFEIITNNIANSLTAGYKATKPAFSMITSSKSVNSGTSQLKNSYVSVYDTFTDFSDAPLVETGAAFDFAIEGSGFFVISDSKGQAYTRNGQFTLNKDNKLVTMSGAAVQGKGGDITIDLTDGDAVTVENDGSIYVGKDLVDVIKVVEFDNNNKLKAAGKSTYINSDTTNKEKTPESYSVRQGFYEASNTNIFKEMVEMIHTLRAYECYAKVDQFFSDINSKLMELGRF